MDIQYLLWLQDLRNSLNGALDPFMEWISLFGVRTILILPAFVYWCISKRKGLFILYAWKISQTINSIVKLTACIYRPWVRDARIIPAGDSIKTASGYSFPSGHTMMAAPIYGGMATCTKNKLARAFWVVMILVLMFSRNYLGVHTPQDVVVGCVLGVLSLYIAHWALGYIDRHPEKDGLVMLISGLAGILTLAYVVYKPYPMDYVDGKLLVDPVSMQVDAWGDAGAMATFALCWYIESRFIKFKETGFNAKGIILCVVGMIPLYWLIWNIGGVMSGIFGAHVGKFMAKSAQIVYIMVIWPIVIKLCSGKRS